jgi:hypothetical protein
MSVEDSADAIAHEAELVPAAGLAQLLIKG